MGDDFEDQIVTLCSCEVAHARRDIKRGAAMIEILARALGSSIAIVGQGDATAIDTLMTGAEAYAHAEAVARTPIARILAGRR